jgi:hypothetical protein
MKINIHNALFKRIPVASIVKHASGKKKGVSFSIWDETKTPQKRFPGCGICRELRGETVSLVKLQAGILLQKISAHFSRLLILQGEITKFSRNIGHQSSMMQRRISEERKLQ